jgi:hypothetical protein
MPRGRHTEHSEARGVSEHLHALRSQHRDALARGYADHRARMDALKATHDGTYNQPTNDSASWDS